MPAAGGCRYRQCRDRRRRGGRPYPLPVPDRVLAIEARVGRIHALEIRGEFVGLAQAIIGEYVGGDQSGRRREPLLRLPSAGRGSRPRVRRPPTSMCSEVSSINHSIAEYERDRVTDTSDADGKPGHGKRPCWGIAFRPTPRADAVSANRLLLRWNRRVFVQSGFHYPPKFTHYVCLCTKV